MQAPMQAPMQAQAQTASDLATRAPAVACPPDAHLRYVLRMGDACLILGQRLSEWCGHAPQLEEDIASANMALDLIGQARLLLTHAGRIEGQGRDEDALAFLREERAFLNPTIVELPDGDFARTVLRNFLVGAFLRTLYDRLQASSDAELAAIAVKSVKETRYHVEHSADWVVRLGDGTEESARRMREALDHLWPYTHEMFEADAVDAQAQAAGIGPAWATLREAWLAVVEPVLADAALRPPGDSAFRSTGRLGRHSEHMGPLLAQMQYLQRAYPGGAW